MELTSSRHARQLRVARVLAATVFLAGCAAGGRGLPQVQEPSFRQKTPTQTLVIGSVRVNRDRKTFGTPGLTPPRHTLVLSREPISRPGDERLFHAFRSDHFFVLLEPGSYAIRQIHSELSGFFAGGRVGAETYVPFEVPENGVVYIGDLEVSFEFAGRFGYGDFEITRPDIAVEDRHDEAVAEFRRLYPSVRRPVENRAVLREAPTRRMAAVRVRGVLDPPGGALQMSAPGRRDSGWSPRGEPADPPSPEGQPASPRAAAPAAEAPRLAAGAAVTVIAAHGDAFGMKPYVESCLEQSGFKVLPAASAGGAIQVRFGYFTLGHTDVAAATVLKSLEATAVDASGTRIAACSEQELPEDSALGYEIFFRCARALGGQPPEARTFEPIGY